MTLNINGYLLDLTPPKVMGILNVTPDSFYSGSRMESEQKIRSLVAQMLEEGADIIDVGGCSTRPGFTEPSEEEEARRVSLGCRIVREFAPDIPLSIDTYRPAVAAMAIKEWKASIINDISGGNESMWQLAATESVAYVLTHNNPLGDNVEDVTAGVITDLAKRANEIFRLGVNDLIIDPGFGFAKTVEQNLELFSHLEEFKKIGLPLLVGISRKSMIYKTLGCSPEESLTGTIALQAAALMKGADIIRAHDVKEAKETIKLIAVINHD